MGSAPEGRYDTTGCLLGAGTAGAATLVVVTALCLELYPSSNLAPVMAFFAAPVTGLVAGIFGSWIGATKSTRLPRILSTAMFVLGLLLTAAFLARDFRLPENRRGLSVVVSLVPLIGAAGLLVGWRKRKDAETLGKGPGISD